MAKKGEVSVIIDAKNKSKGAFIEVKKDLRELGSESKKGLGTFSSNIDKADKVVMGFADRMKGLDKVAKRTFQGTAAAASVYMGATLRDFSQLNDGVAKVNTLYEQTGESQKKMYEDSMKMFKMLPTDFTKITQGIYDTISAGADSEHATMFARKFGMAGVAGDADMDVVTKAAMGTMNAYGLEAQDLNRILDLQFMTVKKGITSYDELASSLGTGVLASAEAAGITLEELQGSIALITKNAIPASVATTSLNQMFNKFTDTKVIKEFKEFGVEIQDANKKTRPLIEIFKDLNYQFDRRKNTSEERKGFLKELVGSEQAARAIMPLLSNLEDYQDVMDSMDNSSGAMRSAYDDRIESMKTQIQMFWNNLKATGIEQIYTLDPLMQSFMEPMIKKQKLEIDIQDLKDMMKFMEDPIDIRLTENEIKELEISLKEIEMAPVETLRDALAESVKELERLNPPLAKFLDTIGGFVLNFVGDEGKENRGKAGNVAKGVAGVYGLKKSIDVIAWLNKNFKWVGGMFKGGDKVVGKEKIPEALVKTLKTMNVNANVVNVYGKSVNNMGDGKVPGMPKGFPKGIPTVVPPATNPIPLPPPAIPLPPAINPIPLPPGGGPIPLPPAGSEVVISEAATAAAAAGAVSMALPLILAATGGFVYYNYKHMGPNEGLVKNLEEQAKMHPAHQRYKNAYDKKGKPTNTPDRDQIESVVNLMNKNLIHELLKINKIQDKIDNTVNLESKINVEPPKVEVSARVYIDGNNIPAQRVEFDYKKIEKQTEVQARRYGKPEVIMG